MARGMTFGWFCLAYFLGFIESSIVTNESYSWSESEEFPDLSNPYNEEQIADLSRALRLPNECLDAIERAGFSDRGLCETESLCGKSTQFSEHEPWLCSCNGECLNHGECCKGYAETCRGVENQSENSACREIDSVTGVGMRMVRKCPTLSPGQPFQEFMVHSLCEQLGDGDMTVDMPLKTPVYGNKQFFGNVFCAVCNGVALQDIEFFKTAVSCNLPAPPTYYSVLDVLDWIEGKPCRVSNIPPVVSNELINNCVQLVNPCETYNAGESYYNDLCNSFVAATSAFIQPSRHGDMGRFVYYRNPLCLACARLGGTLSYSAGVNCGVRLQDMEFKSDNQSDDSFKFQLSFGFFTDIVLEIQNEETDSVRTLQLPVDCLAEIFRTQSDEFSFLCNPVIRTQFVPGIRTLERDTEHDERGNKSSICKNEEDNLHSVNITVKVTVTDAAEQRESVNMLIADRFNALFDMLNDFISCYRVLGVRDIVSRPFRQVIVEYTLRPTRFDVLRFLVNDSLTSVLSSSLDVTMIGYWLEANLGNCNQPGVKLSFDSSGQFQFFDEGSESLVDGGVAVKVLIEGDVHFVGKIASSANLSTFSENSVNKVGYIFYTCAAWESRNIAGEGLGDFSTAVPTMQEPSYTTPVSKLTLSCHSGKVIHLPADSVAVSDGLLRAESVTDRQIIAFKIIPAQDVAIACVSVHPDANTAIIADLRRWMVALLRYSSLILILASTFVVTVLLNTKIKLQKICLSFLMGFGLLSEIISLVIEENTLSRLPCMIGSTVKHFSNISSCAWLLSFSLSVYAGENLGENQSLSYKDKIISIVWGSIFPVVIAVLEMALHLCECTQLVFWCMAPTGVH
ncbi:uncharacterized protein [Ptychodera flava]|uniref:uncharacterized protein n=1 Tax=Ptychodera flava TaxID=63121 RepID=UPI003969EA14